MRKIIVAILILGLGFATEAQTIIIKSTKGSGKMTDVEKNLMGRSFENFGTNFAVHNFSNFSSNKFQNFPFRNFGKGFKSFSNYGKQFRKFRKYRKFRKFKVNKNRVRIGRMNRQVKSRVRTVVRR